MLTNPTTKRQTEHLPVYLFSFFRAPHCADLLALAQRGESFTDSLVMPGVIADFDLTMLSFDGEAFTSAGLFTSAARASTGKRRGKFDFIRTLPVPVPVKQALTRTKQRPGALASTGRIAPTPVVDAMAEKFHLWLRRDFPGNLPILDELFSLQARLFASRGDPSYLALSEQRDGVGLILDIAGQDRRGILGRTNIQGTAPSRSFVDRLPPSTMRTDERRIVEHDMAMFADWKQVRPRYTSTRAYTDGRSTVTLLGVDCSKLEEVAGVDLIYHIDTYDSLVMVQYKRAADKIYTPDRRCHDQLGRMNRVYDSMKATRASPPESSGEAGFRLSNNPFFFKVCDGRVPMEFNESLIEGMYFPHEHWPHVLGIHGPHGADRPKYGRSVSRDTAPRWLSNTEFVDIAKKGWIGSERAAGRDWVKDLVRQCLDDDHALILGRIMNIDLPPADLPRGQDHQPSLSFDFSES